MAELNNGEHGEPVRRSSRAQMPQRRTLALEVVIRVGRLARYLARHGLEIVLAGIILFEEWGWRPLSAALARLARFDVIARLEGAVARLPPWPALAVFLVPSILFLPLKLVAVWLIAGGHALTAALLFAFAKVVGTAFYARIYQLTHPALMQLPWFARLYNWFVPWKEAVIAHARRTIVWQAAVSLKHRASEMSKAAWQRLRPGALALVGRVRAAFGR